MLVCYAKDFVFYSYVSLPLPEFCAFQFLLCVLLTPSPLPTRDEFIVAKGRPMSPVVLVLPQTLRFVVE